MEFQSEKYYFFDKLQKQEIRVRNGNTYFYEEVSLIHDKKNFLRNYVNKSYIIVTNSSLYPMST